MSDYPKDADGESLQRVADDGSDMTAPMDIDFFIATPNEASSNQVAEAASKIGFATEIVFDDEDEEWTVYCTRFMVATHDGVIAVQQELDELAKPFGGTTDGWGTFGNNEDFEDEDGDDDEE